MKSITHQSNPSGIYQFIVVGAGPAGALAVAALLKKGVTPNQILWVDQEFKVGAFGKQWANVPGNTETEKYRVIFREIFALLEKNHSVKLNKELFFMINALNSTYACSLKAAAEPLQLITNEMCGIVDSVEGKATDISTQLLGLKVIVTNSQGKTSTYTAYRVIVATGAEAKSVPLPLKESHKALPLEVAMSRSNLQAFIDKNPSQLTHVAVVGSSHSAALAVMNFFDAGIRVTQFMNKDYRFATPEYDEKGIKRTRYENTGLKGRVAKRTKELLDNPEKVADRWQFTKDKLDDLSKYSHVVSAIGLQAADTIRINGQFSSSVLTKYNKETTETYVKGIFVVGAGYPLQARDLSGEIENNVGLTKFWPDTQKATELWIKNPHSSSRLLRQAGLFATSASPLKVMPHQPIQAKL